MIPFWQNPTLLRAAGTALDNILSKESPLRTGVIIPIPVSHDGRVFYHVEGTAAALNGDGTGTIDVSGNFECPLCKIGITVEIPSRGDTTTAFEMSLRSMAQSLIQEEARLYTLLFERLGKLHTLTTVPILFANIEPYNLSVHVRASEVIGALKTDQPLEPWTHRLPVSVKVTAEASGGSVATTQRRVRWC